MTYSPSQNLYDRVSPYIVIYQIIVVAYKWLHVVYFLQFMFMFNKKVFIVIVIVIVIVTAMYADSFYASRRKTISRLVHIKC